MRKIVKKTLIAVLLIAAICIPAFAIYNPNYSTFSIGAKLNLGTKQGSKQISSIEIIEDFLYSSEFREFREKASFLYSFEDKKDNTFSLDLTYYPELKSESETWSLYDAEFNLNFTGSNKYGKFQGRTIGFDSTLNAASANYFDFDDRNADSYGLKAELGFTYSLDHDDTISGVNAAIDFYKDDVAYKSLYTSEEKTAYQTLSASANFHLIKNQVKVSDAYIGGALWYKIDDTILDYKLGYKYSYDQDAYVNGLYTNLLFANTSEIVPLSEYMAMFASFDGEISLHLINNKLQFQINKLSLNGGLDDIGLMAYSSSSNIVLSGIEYNYSPANDPDENGVFFAIEANADYDPRTNINFNSTADAKFRFDYEGDAIKSHVEELSLQLVSEFYNERTENLPE